MLPTDFLLPVASGINSIYLPSIMALYPRSSHYTIICRTVPSFITVHPHLSHCTLISHISSSIVVLYPHSSRFTFVGRTVPSLFVVTKYFIAPYLSLEPSHHQPLQHHLSLALAFILPPPPGSYYNARATASLAVNITATAYFKAAETYTGEGLNALGLAFEWPSPYDLNEEQRQVRESCFCCSCVWRSGSFRFTICRAKHLPPRLLSTTIESLFFYPIFEHSDDTLVVWFNNFDVKFVVARFQRRCCFPGIGDRG